jgi:hypothetical protein
MAAMTGGEKLKAFLKTINDHINLNADPVVSVGFLEGSTCGIHNDQPAPETAYRLEVGAPKAHIPPRPFFRTMIQTRKATWSKTLARFMKSSNYNVQQALSGLGLVMGEQLQLQITLTTDPPNAPSTIAGKGFDKPLEHSKNMKRAVSFRVGDVTTSIGSGKVGD